MFYGVSYAHTNANNKINFAFSLTTKPSSFVASRTFIQKCFVLEILNKICSAFWNGICRGFFLFLIREVKKII